MNINVIIESLEFIKNIPKGKKLNVNNDILYVDDGGRFQKLRRFVNRDSRTRAMKCIQNIYNQANQIILEITATRNSDVVPQSFFTIESAIQTLRESLYQSIKGLTEFKNTYSDDIKIAANINCIIQIIARTTLKADQWLNIKEHSNDTRTEKKSRYSNDEY